MVSEREARQGEAKQDSSGEYEHDLSTGTSYSECKDREELGIIHDQEREKSGRRVREE